MRRYSGALTLEVVDMTPLLHLHLGSADAEALDVAAISGDRTGSIAYQPPQYP